MKENISSFHQFCRYCKRSRKRLLLLTFLYLLETGLLLLAPRTLSRFIDSVYSDSISTAVILSVLLYLFFVLTQTVVKAFLNVQITSVGQMVTNEYRKDVMRHYLSLDIQTLSGWTSGEAMTRLDEDVEGLFQYFYILIYKLVGSGLTLICILVMLAFKSMWLCIALFVVSVIFILVFKWIQDRGISKYVRKSEADAEFNGTMKELLYNSTTLRALKAESFSEKQLKKSMRERYYKNLPANLMYGNLWSAATFMNCTVIATGLIAAVLLWNAQIITLGMAYMIYTYSEMVVEPLEDFRNHMGNMQGAKAGIIRTQKLLQLKKIESSGKEELPNQALTIDIDQLSFAYENGEDVLHNLNLHIPAGSKIGIMGETGCGKSTLISCIARMHPYSRGKILLGNHMLCNVEENNYRKNVAYCNQRVQLLHTSLRENITLFDTTIEDSVILNAIDSLSLRKWFANFTQGLDTILELGEDNLSSGEARLIALIRLAIRNPHLLLLDEITAGLDLQTEQLVMKAVQSISKDCTILAISHSIEALVGMDQIYFMKDGQLVSSEKGRNMYVK